jgi:FkbM family methyltransferase
MSTPSDRPAAPGEKTSMKSLVKGVVRRLGYDVVKWYPAEFEPRLDVLPRLLKAYFQDLVEANPDFFFIQVGAHDGVRLDPIRESILAFHPRGLLIEPMPDAFSRLRETYRSEPQLAFEQVAIGDEPGHLPFYSIKPGSEWRDLEVVASFDREHVKRFGVPEEYIEETTVEVVTFSSLLERCGIKDATLLQVDTEGYDYRVVKSALEAGLRPKIINYEHIHLSRNDQLRCKRMLFARGYRFVDLGLETLCCLDP